MTTDPLRDEFQSRGFRPVMRSTANFWGYSASYEIGDGWLLLTRLVGDQARDVSLQNGAIGVERFPLDTVELFGSELPVPAVWFTGSLYPERRLVHYVHSAWESSFAESRTVQVESGRVVRLDPPRANQRVDRSAPAAPPSSRRWWRRLLGR